MFELLPRLTFTQYLLASPKSKVKVNIMNFIVGYLCRLHCIKINL